MVTLGNRIAHSPVEPPAVVVDRAQAAPLMVAGALYSLQQLKKLLPLNDRTLAKWKAAGLVVYSPGTKRSFVFADDVFTVIRKLGAERLEGRPL